ncbi:MAG: cation transporter [Acidimicrobiales bacterium]
MTRIYDVPAISCGHCKMAIEGEVGQVAGVESVVVDVEAKQVTVEGAATDDAIQAAIDEAGYEVAGVVTA